MNLCMLFALLVLKILGNAFLVCQHNSHNSVPHLCQLRIFNLRSPMHNISALTDPSSGSITHEVIKY
jgi:hypothetical protein